jgi:hypothetical protein
MKVLLVAPLILPFIAAGAVEAQEQRIPEAKQTVLGLYMTAKEA